MFSKAHFLLKNLLEEKLVLIRLCGPRAWATGHVPTPFPNLPAYSLDKVQLHLSIVALLHLRRNNLVTSRAIRNGLSTWSALSR